MKLSYIIATRDRANEIVHCLDSVANALSRASLEDAEIIVVDNGSKDNTREAVRSWISNSGKSVNLLGEPRPGKSRALNSAIEASRGDILAFTDDDCRLDADHSRDLLRHDAGDTGLVVRGGRVALGDPLDLPLTINTGTEISRWSLDRNSARFENLSGPVMGANMIVRRNLFSELGPFDERLGPGSGVGGAEDTDLIFKAYLAGHLIEYVPDIAVFHFHGRRQRKDAVTLMQNYMAGEGAIYVKYAFKHPNFCRPAWWDLSAAAKEVWTRKNSFQPEIGFSHKDKLIWSAVGAFRYARAQISPTDRRSNNPVWKARTAVD